MDILMIPVISFENTPLKNGMIMMTTNLSIHC